MDAPSRVVVVGFERIEREQEGSTEPVCAGELSARRPGALATARSGRKGGLR
jgi:hypothetical protein